MAADSNEGDGGADDRRLDEIVQAASVLLERIAQYEGEHPAGAESGPNESLRLRYELGELANEYRVICKRLKIRDAMGRLGANLGRTADYIRKHAQFAEIEPEILQDWVSDGESWHSLLKRSRRWPTIRMKPNPDVLDL